MELSGASRFFPILRHDIVVPGKQAKPDPVNNSTYVERKDNTAGLRPWPVLPLHNNRRKDR